MTTPKAPFAQRSATRSRLALFTLVSLFSASLTGCLGCSGEPRAGESLHESFPEQEAQVLHTGRAFSADARAFVLDTDAAEATRSHFGLRARLPKRASDAVELELPGGLTVQVREEGLSGEG